MSLTQWEKDDKGAKDCRVKERLTKGERLYHELKRSQGERLKRKKQCGERIKEKKVYCKRKERGKNCAKKIIKKDAKGKVEAGSVPTTGVDGVGECRERCCTQCRLAENNSFKYISNVMHN